MTKSSTSWLASPTMRVRWVVIACAVWIAIALIVNYSGLGRYLEDRLARPADFHLREWLGQSPQVSDKLKLFSIDDSTFAQMGSWVLSIDEYSRLLATIAERKPRAIFIDAMLSKLIDPNGALTEASQRIANITVPIVTGSYVTAKPIRFREPLDTSNPNLYNLAVMLGRQPGDPVASWELPPLVDKQNWYAYGPSPELRPIFRQVGHFLYDGFGKIAPLLRIGTETVIPHLTLLLAQDRHIQEQRLWLDGRSLPIDSEGMLTVNFVPPDRFRGQNRSLKGLLQRSQLGQSTDVIQAGDVVLILPQMYTGNTDFSMTPFGEIPGGYVLASMLNSVLTGQWLKPLVAGEILIVAASLMGGFLGASLGAGLFWLAFTLGALALVSAAFGLFAYEAIIVPWLMPLFAYLGAGITVFAKKTLASEKKVRMLRYALEGAVGPDELTSILKHPEKISLEARERVVTLMFIDVVGFSLLAENMLPRIAFENLKKMLATIGETIHKFGGIIDKTLGDGLLCYFGYRFDLDASTPDHAEQALRCAISIQQENLKRNIEAAEKGEPVYPLRIGINTSSCYLGDMGSRQRIDFTVVGNGVNFAKRLEGACEMHSCLFGATTYDLVRGLGLAPEAITKRFVRIKHHSELVEAYEYDPFWERPELRRAALEGFRKCANIERIDQRWPVNDPNKIQLLCDFGHGQLVNFSHTGLSIRLNQLLAKGTRINISLDAAGGRLKELLGGANIHYLQGEVRWGYAVGTAYVHGILLTNLAEEQSDYLVQYLCEFAFARDESRMQEIA